MSTPIFILGPPRSGTSVMCLCLRKALNIQGYNEGHFLKYLLRFEKLTNEMFEGLKPFEINKAVAMGNIDRRFFFDEIQLAFKHTYEKLFDLKEKYWVDKTAGTTPKEIQLIDKLWPESKFIVLKRRSLENISSSQKKFPDVPFKAHCLRWSAITKADRGLDRDFFGNRLIDLDHFDLMFNLEKVAEKLTTLLPEFQGLEGDIQRFFRIHFPESSTGAAPKILDIATINWTSEQKEIHRETCSELLDLMGYSLDTSYYQTNRAAQI